MIVLGIQEEKITNQDALNLYILLRKHQTSYHKLTLIAPPKLCK